MISLYVVRLRKSNIHLMVVLGFPVRLVHVGKIDLQMFPLGSQLPEDTLWPEGASVPFLRSRIIQPFISLAVCSDRVSTCFSVKQDLTKTWPPMFP